MRGRRAKGQVLCCVWLRCRSRWAVVVGRRAAEKGANAHKSDLVVLVFLPGFFLLLIFLPSLLLHAAVHFLRFQLCDKHTHMPHPIS